MSISPIESQGSDVPSNHIVEKENPSSNHGVAQLSPPRCGGSSPQRGGAIANSRAPESEIVSTEDSLNPSQTVVGFSVPTRNSPAVSENFQNQTNGIQPNSRRNQGVNANYLLNFSYDPINRSATRGPRAPPPQRKSRKIRPYNKDLFLQANYRFTVLDTGNYEIASMDPDKMLQWEDIICVRHRTAVPVQCPICLEAPLCPQITSCGHIYCFPCILQYLLDETENLKGEIYKRCPLCFMMISTKDLYTLVIENVKRLSVGDMVEFVLLTRSKASLFPKLKNGNLENNPADLEEYVVSDTFAKFVLTSDVDISVQEAKNDLMDWLQRAGSGMVDDDLEKLPYVCAAVEHLEERMKYWTEYRNCATSTRTGTSPPLKNSFSPPKSGAQIDSTVVESSEKGLDEKEGDPYTFYQSADGQLLILHSVNMKCLLHHYGSYDKLPLRISGNILELETVTQSQEMRKRYRFLSHFSLTTTFQLCEIDLEGLVPPYSLAPFMEEIKKREKQRKRLAKKEEKAKAKAEVALVAAAIEGGVAPDPRHYSYSPKDIVFSLDDFEALGNSPAASTSPSTNGERKLFSDVTRLGFASGHDSPSLKPEPGVASLRNNNSTTTAPSTLQGPTAANTLSFANIIATARAPERHETNRTNTDGNGIGIGKKGKKPSRVLLSTSGGRRY